MNIEELVKIGKKYGLSKDDFFQHKHYTIIVRKGIEKIQAEGNISITYEVVNCERDFCAIKAIASGVDNHTGAKVLIETFGSALYGGKENVGGKWLDIGNTTSRYITEVAEKRAMSRAVLRIAGFYKLGVFSEDESDEFKRKENPWINPDTKHWDNALNKKTTIETVKKHYRISKENEDTYKKEIEK